MIRFLWIVAFIQCGFSVKAQTNIQNSIYSKQLNDTVKLTVWLPEGWSPDQQFTTLYTFTYGASDARFAAAQIDYLNRLNISQLAPTIVVSIAANMDKIGYNYETGLLTSQGNSMVKCLREEVFPYVASKYYCTAFRTYMGQSYGASYGNYLFLHQPDLFTGYILMSPEKLNAAQPPFELTPELIQYYNNRNTFYFIASGGKDMQRRQDYAAEIAEKIKKIDSSRFYFKYLPLADANHNNSTAMGLPLALGFIYQLYTNYPEADSSSTFLSLLHQYEKSLNDIFGLQPAKNSFSTYMAFIPRIWQQKDTTGMKEAIRYFITPKSSARQLRDFAYSCTVVGLPAKATVLYEQAIKQLLTNELQTEFGANTLITCYRELANTVAKENPEYGWQLLQKALQVCLDNKSNTSYYPDIYFMLGRFATENRVHLQEGLSYLLRYEGQRNNLVDIIHYNKDLIYLTIAKCHLHLQHITDAKLYARKALEYNKDNQQVKEFLHQLER